MTENENQHVDVSKGVDQLIAKLRDEGVNKGEQKANELLNKARQTSNQLLDAAKQEAKAILEDAKKQADEYQFAAESAIKTAMRDMVLQLKLDLTQEFSNDLKRLVSHQLQQPEILSKMIVELVGRTAESVAIKQQKDIEIILPYEVVGIEELRNNPDAMSSGKLMEFVFGLTREMLQDGVTFSVLNDPDNQGGLKVKLTEQDLVLDLTESAVSDILLQHLQPRFRAILEGVVR